MSVRFLDTGEYQEDFLCDAELIDLETIKAQLLSLKSVLASTKDKMGARSSCHFHADLTDATTDHLTEVDYCISVMKEAR